MTADDWMGIGYAFVAIAYFYIRYFNPGLLRYGLHTLLARYYNFLALLTVTRGFVFALLVYGLLQRAAQTLLHVVTTPLAWVTDKRKLASTVKTPSPVSSPFNSVLDGWIEQDGEEAWKQRMARVMEKEVEVVEVEAEEEAEEKEVEPKEDSLAFLLLPADDHHASPIRRLPRTPKRLYLVNV